jgi:hypothetical protein
MRAIDASKNGPRKPAWTPINPLISPENSCPLGGRAPHGVGTWAGRRADTVRRADQSPARSPSDDRRTPQVEPARWILSGFQKTAIAPSAGCIPRHPQASGKQSGATTPILFRLSLRPQHRIDDRVAQFRALLFVTFDKRQYRIGANGEAIAFLGLALVDRRRRFQSSASASPAPRDGAALSMRGALARRSLLRPVAAN